MKNERKTENIVREELRELEYYEATKDIQVDEQKSNIDAVKRLLKMASKSGKGGQGSPEFIVSSPSNPDFLLVIECKASVKDHASKAIDDWIEGKVVTETAENQFKRIAKFAVDGALHYAQRLSKEFNVIAVAISGEAKKGALISTYLHTKGADRPKILRAKDGGVLDSIIPWADYIEHATFDPTVQRLRFDELMDFSRELHEFMRDYAKLTEYEKPLLVSGTLIALRNKPFAISFDAESPEDLQRTWLTVIQTEIGKANIPQAKKENMAQPYSSIAVHPELGKATASYPRGILHELIKRLNEKVWPFISLYHDFDVVGQFYGEFLKYTGGDKKALGIVLTPRHITELFALLANVNKDNRVLDICAGTGGFLISAMHQMVKTAVTDAERTKIKQRGLIGVEQQPNMFALAASNMILRGDGKANLYQGSCLDSAIAGAIKKHMCDVGMLNPPFSQSDVDQHELRFVKHMMDSLKKGGIGLAITPMSCAISPHPARDELMKHHTLEAVMTMPDELFYPVGVITCVMVFTAHVPHSLSDKKTWFGYWKNDGFTKTKHRGRVDLDRRWPAIRDRWVEMFRNREVHAGESVLQKVGPADEWCAEAYIETDYARIPASVFSETVTSYASWNLKRPVPLTAPDLNGASKKWKNFCLDDLFEIKKGKRLTKANMTTGKTPFIGAIDNNNGVTGYVSHAPLHPAGTITVNYNGAGVAEAFYQPVPYRCSDDVNVLYPKFSMTAKVAMFISSIIRLEKYRFSYGRKWHLERMLKSEIRLPATTNGEPDLKMMENYIDLLPFGVQVT
ncbi:MAG: N-6 DNA methylase [Sulfuritalea sp.]|nr:N-6 DNA methylase [Sulfuritalea sp.]